MSTTWILVANASGARIFSRAPRAAELHEIETLAHPEGRLHEQALGSDRPGRSFDSTGDHRHALGHEVEPHEQENRRFARRLADHLAAAHARQGFQRLVLIAPPRLLGLLRETLDEQVRRRVTQEIDKNLLTHSPADILAHLEAGA